MQVVHAPCAGPMKLNSHRIIRSWVKHHSNKCLMPYACITGRVPEPKSYESSSPSIPSPLGLVSAATSATPSSAAHLCAPALMMKFSLVQARPLRYRITCRTVVLHTLETALHLSIVQNSVCMRSINPFRPRMEDNLQVNADARCQTVLEHGQNLVADTL
jgi:hypothetical protein